ncbi:MAG: hypothetical protein AB7K09_19965 [Planctomycetota bacterium]
MITRTRVHHVALLAVLALAVPFALSCDSPSSKPDKQLPAALHRMNPAPSTPEAALLDRDRLLEDIRLHLTAITGHEPGSAHPVLRQLREDAERVREGVRTLRLEMSMHGLGFEQSMEPFLRALDHHYTVLAQIRAALDELSAIYPPSDPLGAGSDGSGDAPTQTRPR